MTLKQAERELIKEYRWRQRRYSEDVGGYRRHCGNCFNEQHAADRITELENLVEELGGDSYVCLKIAREREDAKC